jgi:large subunit ribosomal protein L29
MKGLELQQMGDDELRQKLAELTEERFRLGFRSATEAVESPIRFRTIRREIARIKTVLRQRQGGEGSA